MNGRKAILVHAVFVCAVSLIASAVSVTVVCCYYSRYLFRLLNTVCGQVVEQEPAAEKIISAVLKKSVLGNSNGSGGNGVLSALGYRIADFSRPVYRQSVLFVMTGLLAGGLLFILAFLFRHKIETVRIRALAEYLEQVNTGKAVILSTSGEDEFSKLEDEIYKTVTFLYQTKDAAVQAKVDFAENLSNIAHQIKTSITAISLSVQMMKQDIGGKYLEQVEKQLLRLDHLEEALLVLSRLDAGTLQLKKQETDVFTLLVLAADCLQELSVRAGTCMDIPEQEEMMIAVDLDWTMEAVLNLMKNCMEHSNGGMIHCTYAQNPLYTEILIWDEGEGFIKKDMPHLFERFYRGQNAAGGGLGIGLALAKEIIERQNGTIKAKNMPEGGACFEIRFYI